MSISKVVSSFFLESPYSSVISSAQAREQREKLAVEQIQHNFKTVSSEVRSLETIPLRPSLKHALAIHRTSEIYFLGKLVVTGVAAYGLSLLSKRYQLTIQEVSFSPVIYQVFIAVIASLYVANLIQKLVRQITSPCTFIQVVSYPSSMSKVALEELANRKKDDGYCDPYTDKPFSTNIKASRFILCGKHVFDLPSLLTNMLKKVDENGNIPHPLYDRFLYKEGTSIPLYNEFLSPKEKEQFLTDVSAFLSIPKDRLEKCWKRKITEAEQDKLNQERIQLEQKPNQVQGLEERLRESNDVSMDLKFSPEVIDFSLNEARKLAFLESKKALIRQKQQIYFLLLLPEAVVLEYFVEMVNEVKQVLDQLELAKEGQVAPQ